jgi:hypothetical protein
MLKEHDKDHKKGPPFQDLSFLTEPELKNIGENLPRFKDLTIEEKYHLVQNLMGHEFIMDKLKEVIDKEIGNINRFNFTQGKKIKRDLSDMNDVWTRSRKASSAFVSQKSTARKTFSKGKRSIKSRCKFFSDFSVSNAFHSGSSRRVRSSYVSKLNRRSENDIRSGKLNFKMSIF